MDWPSFLVLVVEPNHPVAGRSSRADDSEVASAAVPSSTAAAAAAAVAAASEPSASVAEADARVKALGQPPETLEPAGRTLRGRQAEGLPGLQGEAAGRP